MKKYILNIREFNSNVGGTIAMHRLCDLLNKNGAEAYLWVDKNNTISTKDNFNTPTIYSKNLSDFIIIYEGMISGNPLNAPYVVRWFLHQPGFFTKKSIYGENEKYFFYQAIFQDKNFKLPSDHKLHVKYMQEVVIIYKQTNFKKRTGSCYMIRKGKGRELIHDINNSVCIDGLGHTQISKIFNEKKYFYSYDLNSAYTRFAAISGCIPIIVPKKNLSAKEWQPVEGLRYGVAYGQSDNEIKYAIKTRDKVIPYFLELEKQTKIEVKNFIEKTQEFFKNNSKSVETIKLEEPPYIQKLKSTKNKIVFFGATEILECHKTMIRKNSIIADFICDNDTKKHGSLFNGFKVYSPDELFKQEAQFSVLILSSFMDEITEQLQEYKSVRDIFSIFH